MSELDIVDRLKELEPERTRNSEFGPMIYAEAAETIVFLRRLIGELEERVAEDDARWNSLIISASPTPTNDGEELVERLTKALKATTARCAQYADYIRDVAKADELECHPYLPQLDEEVAEALAALNQGAGQ